MRKIFIVLIVIVPNLVLFNTISFSQTKFGIRGGLNFANVSEDLGGTESFDFEGTNLKLPLEQTNRSTYGIGGFIELPFSPMFYLQINALYNQKGFYIEGDLNTKLVEQGIPVNVTVNAE